MNFILSEMTFGILLSLNSIVSLTLNCFLVLFICVIDKRMLRKPINIYILSISISDLLLSGVVTPLFALTSLLRPTPFPSSVNLFIGNLKSCRIVILNFVLAEIACINSIYTMVALAAERHRALVNPFKRAPFSIRHSILTVFTIWSTSIIYGISITTFLFQRFYQPSVSQYLDKTVVPYHYNSSFISFEDAFIIPHKITSYNQFPQSYHENISKNRLNYYINNNNKKFVIYKRHAWIKDIFKDNFLGDNIQNISLEKDTLMQNISKDITTIISRLAKRLSSKLVSSSSTSNFILPTRKKVIPKNCQFRITELRPIYLIDVIVGYLVPLIVVGILYGKIMAALTDDSTHRREGSCNENNINPKEPIKIRISGGQGCGTPKKKCANNLNENDNTPPDKNHKISLPLHYMQQNSTSVPNSGYSVYNQLRYLPHLNPAFKPVVANSNTPKMIKVDYEKAKYKIHSIHDKRLQRTYPNCHSNIYKILSKRANTISLFRQGTSIQKRRAVLMILGIIILFATSWLPLHIIKLMEEFTPLTHFIHSRKFRWLRKLCILFAMISTWANVLVYFYFNEHYKQNFITFMRKICCFRSRFRNRFNNFNEDYFKQLDKNNKKRSTLPIINYRNIYRPRGIIPCLSNLTKKRKSIIGFRQSL
ncbi:unnamed protein product [Gordionus sp. m RMFG-2023]|uniref:uncharacterized protein LOC135925392 n=1 Tax=Gordionus sp. m RMFG-2023 TaxID=3053472 RepID=UPI0030E170BD